MADKERKPTRDPEGSILKRIETRRTANGKTRKETVYYARVRQNEYDQNGKFVRLHTKQRKAENYADAIVLRRKLRQEILEKINAGKHRAQPLIYFFDLLGFYKKHYVKEAVYSGQKKISGQRNPLRNTFRMIASFEEFFGNVPVEEIDYARIFEYKSAMMGTEYKVRRRINPSKGQPVEERQYIDEWRKRTPATVHRYLACLRRILSVGVQQKFIKSNPFKDGDPLIETAVETTRVRNCSYEEEQLLYSVCVAPYREHLGSVILIAIDCFPRENELFSLVGDDIDLENRFLIIRETNAKTLKERTVPLTNRVIEAFSKLKEKKSAADWKSQKIFGVSSVYKAWYTALRLTEIKDLRFHDLRGTGITRMLDAGVPVPLVMKFSGHEKYETFMKYVKKDLGMIQNAGAAMSKLYESHLAEIAKEKNLPSLDDGNASRPHWSVTDLGETSN